MAGYISLSFRESFMLFSIQELKVVKNADNAFFLPVFHDKCLFIAHVDNDKEKYWKHENNQMFTRKIKQLSNIVFCKIWVLNACSSLKSLGIQF